MSGYFNPNKLSGCTDPDPVRQAALLDHILRTVNGTDSLSEADAAALFIDKSAGYDGELKVIPQTTFSKCQELSPHGTWGLIVTDRFSPDRIAADFQYQEVVAYARVIEGMPEQVSKVAVIDPPYGTVWIGGLKKILDAGIYLISDSAGMFCWGKHRPIDMRRQYGYVQEEIFEISPESAANMGDGLLSDMAEDYAGHTVNGFLNIQWDPYDVLSTIIPAMSFGGMEVNGRLRRILTNSGLRSHSHRIFLPPAGCPQGGLVGHAHGICALMFGWNGYLERFGVSIDWKPLEGETAKQLAHCLKELSCPELEEEIICSSSGLPSRKALEESAYAMAFSGDAPEDYLQVPPFKCDIEISRAADGFSHERGSIFCPQEEYGKQQEAISRLNFKLAYNENMPYDKDMRFNLYSCAYHHDGDLWRDGALCWEKERESWIEVSGETRWGVVLFPPDSFLSCDIATHGFLLSGRAEEYDIVICIAWNTEIDEDKVREALEELSSSGIEVIAASGGFLGYPDIPELSEVRESFRSNPQYALSDPRDADPAMLKMLEPAARQVMVYRKLSNPREGFRSPEAALVALPLLSLGRFRESPVWPGASSLNSECLFILDALQPLENFFEFEELGELELAEKVIRLWNRVLSLNGLCFSDSFPIGTSRKCFDRLASVLGIDSYLEALYAGVDLDDLVPPAS